MDYADCFRKLYAAFDPFSDLLVEPEVCSNETPIVQSCDDANKTTKESACPIEKEENPAWPFRSSETNYEIVEKEYSNSPVEEYVATAFGDEIPAMRDDLIERKHHGENFFMRHYHAWSQPANWKVDPENDAKEEEDPAHVNREEGDVENRKEMKDAEKSLKTTENFINEFALYF